MIEDLIRQVDSLQRQVDGLIQPEITRDMISPFRAIPGLVGFWPMSSVQRSTGNAYDLSGQGRTMTYNGNPTYNVQNTFTPYIDLDGTGDFLSRADETDLDILGTETIFPTGRRGMTMGGWFYAGALAAVSGLIGKWTATGNQRSYLLESLTTGEIRAIVSSDGTATTTVTTTTQYATGQWLFCWMRFIPSTSLQVAVNNIITTETTSIPAAIFNSTAALQIGAFNAGTQLLTGRASLCFLSACRVPQAVLSALFQQTRGLFGV